MNPSYDSDTLGWETFEVEYGEPDYSYDTLKFWKTKDGVVLMAHDSGCSCPSPFEAYEGKTEAEIIQKLERVGSVKQAKAAYESGVSDYSKPNTGWQEIKTRLKTWGID